MKLLDFFDGFFSDVQLKRLAWAIVTIVIFIATVFIARSVSIFIDIIQKLSYVF